MAANSSYLRFPNVRGNQLVFAALDDIWLATLPSETEPPGQTSSPVRAFRLTADSVAVSRPRLTPDGLSVVWVSKRAGEPEVFLLPLQGGAAAQLTYFGSPSTAVQGFLPDGRLVVTSAGSQPFRSHTWAYAVDISSPDITGSGVSSPGVTGSSVPEQLPYGPVNGVAFAAAGPVVLGTGYSRDPAHWKRYRGGTAGRLWLAAEPGGQFAEILGEIVGPKTAPIWVGDRLAFLSDYEGHGNVYSVKADGSELRRHTDHADYYARQLSGDGEKLVYAHAGELWLLTDLAADSQPAQLNIELPGSRSGRARVELDAADHVGEFSVDSTGRASAVEVRGTIQWLTHRDGPVRAVAAAPGIRHRLPVVLGGGTEAAAESVAYVSGADGSDAIEISAPEGTTGRHGSGELGRVLELAASPDGRWLAIASHDGRVLLMAAADGSVLTVEANPAGDASGLVFSPDSAWLAYSSAEPSRLRSIKLLDIKALVDGVQSPVTSVTTERFLDTEPAFSLDGKYLMFLSARTFDPVYDAHVFDLSFPFATRPYLVTLSNETPSPFDPELGGRPTEAGDEGPKVDSGGAVAAAGRHAHASDDDQPEPRTAVDLETISARVVPFPVAAGRLSGLQAVKGGVLWLNSPVVGALGEARLPDDDPRASLHRWDFAKRQQDELKSAVDAVAVSGDGQKLLVQDKDALVVLPSDHAAAEDGHESVAVDLSRIRLRIDPPAEWAQMLAETGQLMRDHFWIEDMAGLDWTAAIQRWAPVIDRIATRDDLSDVLWELNGETGSSHAYEVPPVIPVSPWSQPAFLGADLVPTDDGSGWVIARVLAGDNSARDARSPLAAPGVGAVAGDKIVEVNGISVGPAGPAELLRGTAGKPVQLVVSRNGQRRSVVAIPLPNETTLRYLDWVAAKRAAVHLATEGAVGYVHVPDMMSVGWAAFHRDLRVEISRNALIVDTRDNGGGHTSQLIIEKLARRVIGWDTARHLPASTYPEDAPRGPMVSIANEWAGSDGDIVNAAFKALQLGPVIGTRTWGGVIGIDGRYTLVDGTAVTQPRYSFWFEKFGWAVENHGVDPDYVVEYPPHAWAPATASPEPTHFDADPQLSAAIGHLLGELQARPVPARPDLSTRASLRAPSLPPRRIQPSP